MSIPGGNLLGVATRVLAQQKFVYFPYLTRQSMPNGLYKATYGAGTEMCGSAQPVPRSLYQNLGLDFQRLHYNFFVQIGIIDIARNVAGDQFVFEGKNFQALSKTPWHGIDGWEQVLCVHVPQY